MAGQPFSLSEQQKEKSTASSLQATEQLRFLAFPISTEHHLGHEWTFSGEWTRGADFQNELHANMRFFFQGSSPGAVAVSKPNRGPWEEARSHDREQAAPWSLLLRNERKPHPGSISWSKVKTVFISHCRPALALNGQEPLPVRMTFILFTYDPNFKPGRLKESPSVISSHLPGKS